MLDLINRRVHVVRHLFQAHPDQDGTPNMVPNNPRLPALTPFNARDLFGFAVKLLNLPAPAAHCVDGQRRILSHVVGDTIVRALGGQHTPEQFHFRVVWQALEFDGFALIPLLRRPRQAVHALIGLTVARVIDLPIVLQRTVVILLETVNALHQCDGGIPRIHQHGAEGHLFLIHRMSQPIRHMIEFACAITSGVVDPIIDDPEAVDVRIDIHTGHDPDALNDAVGVATVLPPYQLNGTGIALIQHRIVEDQIAGWGGDELLADIFPDQARRNTVVRQVAVERIVAELLGMIGKVRQRIVDLATDQILAVVQPVEWDRWCVHAQYHTRRRTVSSNPEPRLRKS